MFFRLATLPQGSHDNSNNSSISTCMCCDIQLTLRYRSADRFNFTLSI